MFRRILSNVLAIPPSRPHPFSTCHWIRCFSSSSPLSKRRAIPSMPYEVEVISCDPEESRLDKARARRLFNRVQRFVRFGKHAEAVGLFHNRMSESKFHNMARSNLYEEVIGLLLHYKRPDDAINVYIRMSSEGFLASAQLRAMMLVLGCARTRAPEAEMLSGLEEIFKSTKKEFDDTCLDLLLSDLAQMGQMAAFLEKVLDRYMAIQSGSHRVHPNIVARLIAQYCAAKRFDDAERWLLYHSAKVTDSSTPSHARDVFPYTSFIHGLSRNSTDQANRYQPVLALMFKDGVMPDTALFNTIIKAEAACRRFDKAFELYRVLQSQSTRDLFPDAFTFGTLFIAHEQNFHAQLKGLNSDKLAHNNLISPRRLFRDMLTCHDFMLRDMIDVGWSDIINKLNMHHALRLFVNSADYAAALVVLRSFTALHFQPNYQTTYTVVSAISRRVRRELRAANGSNRAQWSLRYFGVGDEERNVLQNASLATIQDKLTKIGVLCLLAEQSYLHNMDVSAYQETNEFKTEFASKIMLDDKRGLHIDLLAAILQRALEASIPSSRNMCPSLYAADNAELVREHILQAKDEMVPSLSETQWSSFSEFFKLAPTVGQTEHGRTP